MKLLVGADHAGFELKERVKEHFGNIGFIDKGCYSTNPVDYPDFAHQVAESLISGEAGLGILICGSANGVSIAANRHKGIRAAIAWTPELAKLARQHNDANILCLPARFITTEQAYEIVKAFLEGEFEAGRHQRRVDKIEF